MRNRFEPSETKRMIEYSGFHEPRFSSVSVTLLLVNPHSRIHRSRGNLFSKIGSETQSHAWGKTETGDHPLTRVGLPAGGMKGPSDVFRILAALREQSGILRETVAGTCPNIL